MEDQESFHDSDVDEWEQQDAEEFRVFHDTCGGDDDGGGTPQTCQMECHTTRNACLSPYEEEHDEGCRQDTNCDPVESVCFDDYFDCIHGGSGWPINDWWNPLVAPCNAAYASCYNGC